MKRGAERREAANANSNTNASPEDTEAGSFSRPPNKRKSLALELSLPPLCVHPTHTLYGHRLPTTLCALSRDGKVAISVSWDRTMRMWDVETGKPGRVLMEGKDVLSCALSEDGAIAVAAVRGGHVHAWKTRTGERFHTVTRNELPNALYCALTPDGHKLIASFCCSRPPYRGLVVTVNLETGEQKDLLSLDGRPEMVVTCDDGSVVGIVDDLEYSSYTVLVVDGNTGEYIQKWTDGEFMGTIAMDATGTQVAIADSRTLWMWRVREGRKARVLANLMTGYQGTGMWHTIGMTPDGSRVITVARNLLYAVWDTTTGRPLAILRGHEQSPYGCAISGDGTVVVSCSMDKTMRIWSLEPIGALQPPVSRTFRANPASEAAIPNQEPPSPRTRPQTTVLSRKWQR